MGIHNPEASQTPEAPTDHTTLSNLDFASSGHTGFASQVTADTKLTIGGDAKGAKITVGTNDNQGFSIKVNNSERVTVTSVGYLGINTTTPVNRLHVFGGITTTGANATIGASRTTIDQQDANTSRFFGLGSDNTTKSILVLATATGNASNYVENIVVKNDAVGINTSAPAKALHVTGDALIGGAANNTQFATDGSITLQGTARKTTNLWVPATSFHSVGGSSGASLSAAGLSFAMQFSASQDQTASVSLPLPLDMDMTMPMQILLGRSNSSNTGNTRWQIKYLYVDLDEVANSTTPDETLQQTLSVSGTANGLGNIIFQTIVPSATDKMLHVQITRLGSDPLDTCTGTTNIYGAMILYTTNKLGV